MLSLAVLALFARLAAAAPASGGAVINVGLASGSTPLDVVATVSNTGASDVAVLKYSPLLASTPIKHFRVFDSTGAELPFGGVTAFFDVARAGAEAWEQIPAGQSIDRTIDLAQIFQFQAAGEYTIAAAGVLQVVENEFSASAVKTSEIVEYAQNLTVSLTDSDVAASVAKRQFLQKRLAIGTCTSSQVPIYKEDFAGAKRLAIRAIERTRARDSRFNTWFNTMDDHYIDFVANTFQKIEDASTVSTTSNIIANCNDPSNFCSGGIVAYAVFSIGVQGRGQIYTCPSYWTLPPYPSSCNGYGRADVMLHELSHFYDTTDHAYGFDAAQRLSPALAAHNADTYMFYARSLNC